MSRFPFFPSILVLAGFIGITHAFAEERPVTTKNQHIAGLFLPTPKTSPVIMSKVQVHATFLGCVYSRHECSHLAHNYGFYNHFIIHDHATCHHGPSYACYGQ
jgi:hypothetical protein